MGRFYRSQLHDIVASLEEIWLFGEVRKTIGCSMFKCCIAISMGVCELISLRMVLENLGVETKKLMQLFCDNKMAINIANDPIQYDITKHTEIERQFIKEKILNGLIYLPLVN